MAARPALPSLGSSLGVTVTNAYTERAAARARQREEIRVEIRGHLGELPDDIFGTLRRGPQSVQDEIRRRDQLEALHRERTSALRVRAGLPEPVKANQKLRGPAMIQALQAQLTAEEAIDRADRRVKAVDDSIEWHEANGVTYLRGWSDRALRFWADAQTEDTGGYERLRLLDGEAARRSTET